MPAYINNPVTGSPTPLDSVDAVYGLALMYGRLLVGGANIQSRYDFFDKDFMEYGAIVADYKVKAVESKAVNPTNSNFGAASYPEVLKLYFAEWNDRSYEVEIKDSEAYSVVDGSTSFEVFVAQIINALNEGERMEKNMNYERLLYNAEGDGNASLVAFAPENVDVGSIDNFVNGYGGILKDLNQFEYLETPTDENVFTEIRNIVKGMTFENGVYSGGYVSGARLDDIRIIAPYQWLNKTGVTFLSRLFNLSEADTLARIIEAPNLQTHANADFGADGVLPVNANTIIILHRNAIGRVVRYRSSMTDFVRQRWSRWFGNEVVDMYYFNKYEKAYAISFVQKA